MLAAFLIVSLLVTHLRCCDAALTKESASLRSAKLRRRAQINGISSLTLIDAWRSVDLFKLEQGKELSYDVLNTMGLNVRADISGTSTVSVKFYHKDVLVRTDSTAPFTLADKKYSFDSGTNVLRVVAYNNIGSILNEVTLTFTLVTGSENAQNVPKLITPWSKVTPNPNRLAESSGCFLDNGEMIVAGGFLSNNGWYPRRDTYALHTTSPATWEKLADYPLTQGMTHGGYDCVGNKLYICGGYLGKSPGNGVVDCFVLDRSAGSSGEWTSLPSLPEPRGGGGMLYISSMNALFYAFGATRPYSTFVTIDHSDSWMLLLDDTAGGWIKKADTPYTGNHIATVAAKDCMGQEHYYMFGGQHDHNTENGNIDLLYEYMPVSNTWVQRTSMTVPRGHMASSAVAVSCGFLVVGGAIDTGNPDLQIATTDVSYYDIPTNTWTSIGDYPRGASTPVCGITKIEDIDYLYCGVSTYENRFWRRQIAVT